MAMNERPEGDDQIFWEGLRRSLAEAEAGEREELAVAERELAEIEGAPALPGAQIDAIVQRATAPGNGEGRKRSGPWVRILLAAAAILLAPKVFATVGSVTAAAVAGFMVQDPTGWMRYQEAVHIALTEEHQLANRLASQGTVFADTTYTLVHLREMAAEDAEMAEPVAALVRELRAQLAAPKKFEERHLRGDMQAVEATVLDRAEPLGRRREELTRLGEFLSYGLSAMQHLAQDPSMPPKMKKMSEIFLQQFARELE